LCIVTMGIVKKESSQLPKGSKKPHRRVLLNKRPWPAPLPVELIKHSGARGGKGKVGRGGHISLIEDGGPMGRVGKGQGAEDQPELRHFVGFRRLE